MSMLQWVLLSTWQGKQLALALDATTLGTSFTMLTIHVVSRGGAMSVDWTILPAQVPHAWRREWLRMLRLLRRPCPTGGPSSCWLIGACMPAGCVGGS